MPKFIVHNIKWDIDIKHIISAFDEMTAKKASQILDVPYNTYTNMSTEERHDYIYDAYHHNRQSADELFELPEEIEIPEEFGITAETDDMQDVTNWIADEYGWYINGYDVKST